MTTGFANLSDGAKVDHRQQRRDAVGRPRAAQEGSRGQGKDGQAKDGQARDGQAKDGQGHKEWQGKKDWQGKDGERRHRRDDASQGEGDQKGRTGPAPAPGASRGASIGGQCVRRRDKGAAMTRKFRLEAAGSTGAMSVSEPFIRRPIATSLLGIALLIGGVLGYFALPVSALPQVDFPTVQVTTQLPGASPDVIASLITAPLERQLGQIPSLSSMNSTSSFGVSQISLQFDLNRDIDGATQDVQAAINAAAGVLPKTLPYPPVYAKVNPADAPVLTLALTSETISLRAMSDIADTILAQRLSQISGVGRVTVLGGLKPAVRVQADLARLAAYGIAMEDLRNAIAGANVSGPKGSLDGAQQSYTIAANDQIAAADAYKPIIIAYRNGAPVTIGDVAVIVDGLENDRTGGWYQGTPAVIIDIQRQPGANVIEVVRQIRAEIPRLQRAIPAGVNLTIVSDRTVTIRASVHDVQFTLVLAVVLVTLVVLLFLRSLRATIIAGVALPLSLITSLRRDVFRGLQPRQSVADGADDRHRFRGRRRHRDDREHRSSHGERRIRDERLAARRQRNRLHRDLADGVADRGVHSAAVHVRAGRPHVPRVRADTDDRGRDFGGGLADADADDVLAPPEACGRGDVRSRPRRDQPADRPHGRCLPSHAALGAGAPARDHAGHLCDAGRDDDPLCRRAEGLPAAAGHRLDHRGDPGGSGRLLCRDAEPADRGCRCDQEPIRM